MHLYSSLPLEVCFLAPIGSHVAAIIQAWSVRKDCEASYQYRLPYILPSKGSNNHIVIGHKQLRVRKRTHESWDKKISLKAGAASWPFYISDTHCTTSL